MASAGTVVTHADLQRVRQSLLNKSALRNLGTGDVVSSVEGRDENHVQVIFKSKLFIDELPEIEEEANGFELVSYKIKLDIKTTDEHTVASTNIVVADVRLDTVKERAK